MVKTTLRIDGMACEMCEAHINDAVRRSFRVKKVTSSHRKGCTEIITEQPLDEAALRGAIDATGYTVSAIDVQPYEKKGFWPFAGK